MTNTRASFAFGVAASRSSRQAALSAAAALMASRLSPGLAARVGAQGRARALDERAANQRRAASLLHRIPRRRDRHDADGCAPRRRGGERTRQPAAHAERRSQGRRLSVRQLAVRHAGPRRLRTAGRRQRGRRRSTTTTTQSAASCGWRPTPPISARSARSRARRRRSRIAPRRSAARLLSRSAGHDDPPDSRSRRPLDRLGAARPRSVGRATASPHLQSSAVSIAEQYGTHYFLNSEGFTVVLPIEDASFVVSADARPTTA